MAKASALRDLTVSQLEKVLLAKKSKLEDLVGKRDKLRLELNSLDQQIRGLAGTEEPSEEAPRRRGRPKGSLNKKGRRGPRVKGQKSLRKWIIEELEKNKKGMTLDDLITAVQSAGYRSKAVKFQNVVYQCLYHHFKRDEESGLWVIPAE